MASVLLALLSCCTLFLQADSQYCRERWYHHGGSCYGFGDSLVSWGDAQTICQVYSGKLAEIETADENEFLKTIVKGKQAVYTFLGGTDMFGEGVWEWTSSGYHISPFVDWPSGQPDDNDANNEGEDCLVFSSLNSYRWNDLNCNHASNFICETMSTEGAVVG